MKLQRAEQDAIFGPGLHAVLLFFKFTAKNLSLFTPKLVWCKVWCKGNLALFPYKDHQNTL